MQTSTQRRKPQDDFEESANKKLKSDSGVAVPVVSETKSSSSSTALSTEALSSSSTSPSIGRSLYAVKQGEWLEKVERMRAIFSLWDRTRVRRFPRLRFRREYKMGQKNEARHLFVRQCYPRLFTILMNDLNFGGTALLVGTPGNGKIVLRVVPSSTRFEKAAPSVQTSTVTRIRSIKWFCKVESLIQLTCFGEVIVPRRDLSKPLTSCANSGNTLQKFPSLRFCPC